jgi:hypothetical protein
MKTKDRDMRRGTYIFFVLGETHIESLIDRVFKMVSVRDA